jgi:alpha-mannosidase
VKLVIPSGNRAEYEVPGATVVRGPSGEVPGGRWVRIDGAEGSVGFASDSLYNFDTKDETFRVTLARASRYADDVNTPPDHEPWRPAVDAGELRFNFVLTPDVERLPVLAQQLEQPPVSMLVPPHPGKLPRGGTLAALEPDSVRLLALKPAQDGKSALILRLQETAGRVTTPALTLLGQRVKLPKLKPHQIATLRLSPAGKGGKGFTATLTNILEQ